MLSTESEVCMPNKSMLYGAVAPGIANARRKLRRYVQRDSAVKIKLVVAILTLFFSQIASACSCDGLSPEDSIDSSKAIMIVYVVETKVKEIPDNILVLVVK